MKKCIIEDKHNTMNCSHCFMCGKKIGETYREKMQRMAKELSNDIKQKIIDLIHEGKSIGDVKEILKIEETGIIAEIILGNVGNIQYLKKENSFI